MRTRVRARFIIGFEADDHVIYEDGDVVYEGDSIVFVGQNYHGPFDELIDVGNAIVSPGFIDLDALGDIDHAILDTWLPDDLARATRWSEQYFEVERREIFSPDERAFIREYALIHLILNGVTTAVPIAAETYTAWAETAPELATMAQIAQRLGIRIYLGPSYRAGVNITRPDGTPDVLWDEDLGRAGMADAIGFVRTVEAWRDPLVRGMLAPARIETMTWELLQASRQASDALACPIRLHAAQAPLELEFLERWYGQRPIELLAAIGFLGPRTLIVHARFLGGPDDPCSREDDLARLRDTDTKLIYCPLTNARNGFALDSFDRYRAAGITIGLGTDTFPPDLIRAMDVANSLGKVIAGGDRTAAPVAELFRALTLGGAAALGRPDLGRLAVGAKADLTIIDLDAIETGPIDDPLRTMVMNGSGRSVKTVVVNGRTIMRDRIIPGLDREAMHARAQRLFRRYKRAYGDWDYQRRTPDELFPPAFPIRPARPVEQLSANS